MSNQISLSNNSNPSQVSCDTILLKKLLLKTLSIPAYQRGYCWRSENIVALLDDIYNHKNASNASFHLGTIIVKQGEKDELSIIDGQQRLITLSILIYISNEKGDECVPLLQSDISETENISKEHIGYIIRALKTIEMWFLGKDKVLQFFLDEIKVCLVTIPNDEPEDLAYRFFNATNATGKQLSDYDLLKTHHLRYVPDHLSGLIASKWNLMDENRQEELLNYMLYRLRNWSYKDKPYVEPDKYGRRLLFEHYSVKYSIMDNISVAPTLTQYNSIFNGGIDFFEFVDEHRLRLDIFENFEDIKELEKKLRNHSNGVLCNAIKAITFLFYLKFGEYYLSEALFCIAYRISELRNENYVRKDFIHTQNVFQDLVQIIDTSTNPSVLFVHCLKLEYRYISENTEGVRENYLRSLHELFTCLPNKHILPVENYAKILNLEPKNDPK